MTCRNYKELLMGYLDNELDDEQREDLARHLASCAECSKELKEFEHLKKITDDVTLVDPDDKMWEQYWGSIYNRIERGVGWILFSIAAIVLVTYGGFKAIEDVVTDPTVGLVLKAGLVVLIVGLAVLFVSVVRERIFFWKNDRYKDIRR